MLLGNLEELPAAAAQWGLLKSPGISHCDHPMAVIVTWCMHVRPCCHSPAAACPAGTFSSGSEVCADCPKGSFCEGGIFSLKSPPVNKSCPDYMTTLGSSSQSARACGKLRGPLGPWNGCSAGDVTHPVNDTGHAGHRGKDLKQGQAEAVDVRYTVWHTTAFYG